MVITINSDKANKSCTRIASFTSAHSYHPGNPANSCRGAHQAGFGQAHKSSPWKHLTGVGWLRPTGFYLFLFMIFFFNVTCFVDRSIFGHLQVLAIPVFIFGYDLFSFFSGHVAMVPRLLCVKVFSNK